VNVGKPDEAECFDAYEIEDFTVYVQKDINPPTGKLLISTSTFLWFEKLVVIGML